MERREFLKVSMASFLALMAPAEEIFAKALQNPQRKAKGVIFLVGDGFPLGVIKATYEFKLKKFKEESYIHRLLMDPKACISIQNTSSLNSVVTDSAPASAAWATGSKTAQRMLSILPDGRRLTTIFELAKEKGIACGFVTTTRITHATPAAWYSHNPNRDSEDDIAEDLLNSGLIVAMGGGDRHLNPERRKDKKDLYTKFKEKGYTVAKNRDELLKAQKSEGKLLGVFSSSHMAYFVDRINDPSLGSQPSLPEMTLVALERLSKNPKGFILQIEAGRIDHANHANDAYGALMDAYEMDSTVKVVMEFIRHNPQVLLIVTSDHGNSGYGINGTGPEYVDSTKALLSYENRASFEYMINQMKKKDLSTVKEIFETYTRRAITIEEAQEIFKKLNEPHNVALFDVWYEPEATMGRILMKSVYAKDGDNLKSSPEIRRGNVGFTSTNHTAEDQIAIFYPKSSLPWKIPPYIDNTDIFRVLCGYFGIRHENPKMRPEEMALYERPITLSEWRKHLRLHIS
ncbi:MAG: alkaline phosphatase [Desulfobacterota bacterium]|nr:alkaline phosphatase [Thermodesulfobacteriota bacterium]MDW8002010.1 alkaline phosphatase [Deltaproteobacteria bacterium]